MTPAELHTWLALHPVSPEDTIATHARLRYMSAVDRWARLRENAGYRGTPWRNPDPASTPALVDARDAAYIARDAWGEAIHARDAANGVTTARFWWEPIANGVPTAQCTHGFTLTLAEMTTHREETARRDLGCDLVDEHPKAA